MPDLSTGFVWALPAAALAAVFTVLPLPARPASSSHLSEANVKEFFRAAGAGGLLSLNEVEILHDMKNMTRKFALASDLPVK